jgi:translation initiation factor 1
VKDGVIEVQGDHCDLVMEVLAKQGHQPKRAGG